MIVYVAGASRERERARRAIGALRAAGLEVAHDWPTDIDAHDGRANEGLTPEERERCALACWNAVRRADAILLLVPHALTTGAWFELGVACAGGLLLVASGAADDFAASIFTELADHAFARSTVGRQRPFVQCEMDDAAIAWLRGYAEARAIEDRFLTDQRSR